MILRVVNSCSSGNGYVLEDENGSQLLIEAGCHLYEYREIGKMRRADAAGMVISHGHNDHAKWLREFTRAGIEILSTPTVAKNNMFVERGKHGETYHYGDYSVTPIHVDHDTECFAYLIHHKEMGTLLFATDCYNLKNLIMGIQHYMIEANYDDDLLEKALKRGKTVQKQADRVELSHMSVEHCISYLDMCEAKKSAKTIILIHGSKRHLDKGKAKEKVEKAFGIATFVAEKGMEIKLEK